MRWLFIFLLLLNIAYIAWQINQPSNNAYYSTAKQANNDHSILLLSEVRARQQTEKLQNRAHEVASIPGSSPAKPGQAGAGNAGSGNGDSGKTVVAKSGVEKNNKPALDAAPVKPVQKPLSVGKQDKSDVCYTFGPFSDLDVLRKITGEIKPYVVSVDFRGKEVKEQSLYWVYIKPFKDRQTAIAMGMKIKAGKVRDYFVIRKGENANGISLGYFRKRQGADKIEKKVKKLGFDVVVEPKFKSYTVYWLDYQLQGDAHIPQSIFDKYIRAAKDQRIKRLHRDCAV